MLSDKMNSNFSSGLSATDSEYNSALEYLYGRLPMFSRVGAAAYKPGLETSIALAKAFGNPHEKFRCIHIAGTNGKGSTSHNIASILQEAGLKTALYTSPHLVDFRERIRINGSMIPQEKVVEFVDRWKAMNYEGSPSFFELTMMMAFDWFASEKVDVAVIEVGMGGRLDSTNILTPELSIITNISKDHTQFLGSTLEAIASEKAGIIKKGIPVVIGEAEGEVRTVFADRAYEVGAPIIFADDCPDILKPVRSLMPTGWECLSTLGGIISSPLGGSYQLANLRTVLVAAKEIIGRNLFPVTENDVAKGIANVVVNTGLMGRWMVTGEHPLTICDTGHNEAGIRYNVAQLREMMRHRHNAVLRIVMGFVADKAIDDILALLPEEAEYYLSNARIPRALPVAELGAKCRAAGLRCREFATVTEAAQAAHDDCGRHDILFVGGSTFIVADYLAGLQQEQ